VRVRSLTAAALATLAIAGITGCRSNAGNAATVNGERISDSKVSAYITPSAQPVAVSQSERVAPKSFVVQILINVRLYQAVIKKAPNGGPKKGDLAAISRQALGGKSPKAFAEAQKIIGYTPAFDREVVSFLTYQSVLQTYQRQGVDVKALVAKTKVSVSVNPRYGKWDKNRLTLDGSVGAGVPGFVKLQPTTKPIAVRTQ